MELEHFVEDELDVEGHYQLLQLDVQPLQLPQQQSLLVEEKYLEED